MIKSYIAVQNTIKKLAPKKPSVSREHDPIAYDSFNIHENDPKIKPDVLVSKQHMLRVSPTTLKNLAGQFLDRIDYHSINFIKQIEIYMNFT